MKRSLLVPALLLAACSSGGSDDEQVACADLVGMTASAELLEAPCTLPDGGIFVGGVGTAECTAGTMLWNDSAWGYVGEPLQSPETWPGHVASTSSEPSGMDAAGCS